MTCLIDFKGSRDDHLAIEEFTYNNGYHSNIQMSPYEALYRCKSRSPFGWFQLGEKALLVPDSIHDAIEIVQLIRDRLKKSQSREKSYADVRRNDL